MLPRKKVYQYTAEGELVATWDSLQDVQDSTVYFKANISAACNGKCRTSYGYVWSFVELTPTEVAAKSEPRRKPAETKTTVKPADITMQPYLKYVKYLYSGFRNYAVEEEFTKSIEGVKLTDLPHQFKYWLNISRKFTMYYARNLMYHCGEPNVVKLLRYLEDVELAVAAATCKMSDWRGVVDAIMRTIAEEWRYSLPESNNGKRRCIPAVALHPETLEPLMVFGSTVEAVGVTGTTNIQNSMKFGSVSAGARWQAYADWKAGKPLPKEKIPRDKTYETNPFEFGVESLV